MARSEIAKSGFAIFHSGNNANPATQRLQALALRVKTIPLNIWRGLAVFFIAAVWVLSSVAPLLTNQIAAKHNTVITDIFKLSSSLSPHQSRIDIKKLKSTPLFGDAKATPSIELKSVKQTIMAVESKLSLQLSGIVSSNNPQSARAIISHQHKQKIYALGDKLPGGHQVSLEKILQDRVIISNSGNYESLSLFEEKHPPAGNIAVPSKENSFAARQSANKKSDITTLTGKNLQGRTSVTTLADVIKMTVAREGDRIIGYRIRPGHQHQLFNQFGFEANDIITHVNGVSVDDASKAMSVYKQIRSQQSATFNLIRNGQPLNLGIELSSISNEDGNA